jgi:hypothetical protein
MKYLVMVQNSQADYDAMDGKDSATSPAWSPQEVQTMYDFMAELNKELAASGEWVDGNGLAGPAQTRLVQAGQDGRPVITDGPFVETKEMLAGYWVLDCASLERVTEIAARVVQCPLPTGATAYPVVIRPITDA